MLKTRVLTAVLLLVAFFLAVFYLPQNFWRALVVAIFMVASWEWGNISSFTEKQKWVFTILGTALLLILILAGPGKNFPYAEWLPIKIVFAVAAAFWLVIAPWWLWSRWQISNKFILAMTGLIVLMPFALALIHLRFLDALVLLAIMGVVWVADIAAYFSGKKFGKHKLAPALSPGKTWEGVLGALLATILYGFVLSYFVGISALYLILATAFLTVLSIVGDLFESMMKRQSGLKDSGQILPGHGGLLDRVDALTSALPVAAFVIFFDGFF